MLGYKAWFTENVLCALVSHVTPLLFPAGQHYAATVRLRVNKKQSRHNDGSSLRQCCRISVQKGIWRGRRRHSFYVGITGRIFGEPLLEDIHNVTLVCSSDRNSWIEWKERTQEKSSHPAYFLTLLDNHSEPLVSESYRDARHNTPNSNVGKVCILYYTEYNDAWLMLWFPGYFC